MSNEGYFNLEDIFVYQSVTLLDEFVVVQDRRNFIKKIFEVDKNGLFDSNNHIIKRIYQII